MLIYNGVFRFVLLLSGKGSQLCLVMVGSGLLLARPVSFDSKCSADPVVISLMLLLPTPNTHRGGSRFSGKGVHIYKCLENSALLILSHFS